MNPHICVLIIVGFVVCSSSYAYLASFNASIQSSSTADIGTSISQLIRTISQTPKKVTIDIINSKQENHKPQDSPSGSNAATYKYDYSPDDISTQNEPYLVVTPSILKLGGKNLNSGSVTVSVSDGSNLSPLVLDYVEKDGIYLSTKPSSYSDTDSLPVIARTRDISVWDAYLNESGKMTINIKSQYNNYSGSFIIQWEPVPTFEATNTGVQRTDNGETITYDFGFSIKPIGYFGNPTIVLSVYHNGICLDNSESRKIFKHNNINSFSVSCTVNKGMDLSDNRQEKLQAVIDNITREDGYGMLGEGSGGGYSYILSEGYDQ